MRNKGLLSKLAVIPRDNLPVKVTWNPRIAKLTDALRAGTLGQAARSALSAVGIGRPSLVLPTLKPGLGRTRDQKQLESEVARRGVTSLREVDHDPDRLPAEMNELLEFDADGSDSWHIEDEGAPFLRGFSFQQLKTWLPAALAAPRPALEIRAAGSAGDGLFAAEDLGAGTVVGLYTGELRATYGMPANEKRYLFRPPAFNRPRRLEIAAGHLAIDSRTRGNETRFINHSAQPNLEVMFVKRAGLWVPVFVASRHIPKGEQLTFDYGPDYWSSKGDTPIGL